MREIAKVTEEMRPIWYIYACTGTQWPNCAREMMHLDVFRKSIYRCAEILRPKGIDLVELLTSSDESIFDNIQNIFISIAAIQVALTDLLAHIDIIPNGIIGVSFGEFGCAYGDGGFTTEQFMLASYWRVQCLLDTKLEPGLVVVFDLPSEKIQHRLPEEVYVIARNGPRNVVVSSIH